MAYLIVLQLNRIIWNSINALLSAHNQCYVHFTTLDHTYTQSAEHILYITSATLVPITHCKDVVLTRNILDLTP